MNQERILSNIEKAAVLMMTLSSDEAAQIMKHLGPKQVQRLGLAMASIRNVPKRHLDGVLDDFTEEVDNQTSVGVSKDEQIREMMYKALGEDKANGIVDRILMGAHTKGLDTLKWMEPRAIADIIKYEHPQIQSIILSYLDGDVSAQVLSYFETNTSVDLMMRIASQETIQPAALHELNVILERSLNNTSSTQMKSLGGAKVAANIMNFVDSSLEGRLNDEIKTRDEVLFNSIQDLMFVFENLSEIDDRSMQRLLKEVKSEQLILALKGADDHMKDKVFRNMSSRAADLLKDDLAAKGPVKVKDVESAQKEILSLAKRLADLGEISLGGRGADEMIA